MPKLNLHTGWDCNSVKQINGINTLSKPRTLWPQLKYITVKRHFKEKWCDVKSLSTGYVTYETPDRNPVISGDSHFSGVVTARTGWHDRLAMETVTSFFFYQRLNLERQGLSWSSEVWTTCIPLHWDLSNTTSKADGPYTDIYTVNCITIVPMLDFTKANNHLVSIDTGWMLFICSTLNVKIRWAFSHGN